MDLSDYFLRRGSLEFLAKILLDLLIVGIVTGSA